MAPPPQQQQQQQQQQHMMVPPPNMPLKQQQGLLPPNLDMYSQQPGMGMRNILPNSPINNSLARSVPLLPTPTLTSN